MNKRLGPISLFFLFLLYPLFWEDQLPDTWPLAVILLLVGVGVWLVYRWRVGMEVFIPKLILVFLALLAYQGVTLLRGPVPLYGLRWILFQLALFVIFILVVNTSRTWNGVQRWEKILITASITFAGLSVVAMLAWYGSWWRISAGGFSFPPITIRSNGIFFFHPNMFAAYLNLAIPLVLVRVLRAADRGRRILWLEGLLLMLLAEFFTASRGGWLGLAASVITVLALYFIPGFQRSEDRLQPRNARRKLPLALAGIVLGLVVVIPLIVYQINNTPHGKLDWRLAIWQYALELIKESPVIGQGLGAFPFLYTNRLEAYGVDEVFHAHNLWLQVGGETGLVGLILLLTTLVTLGRGFRSAWRNTQPGIPERASLIAYAGVLAGLLIHSLVDVPIRPFANGLSLAIILALVYHRATAHEFTIFKPRLAFAMMVSVLLIYGGTTLVYRQADLAGWKAISLAQQGDWQSAADRLCAAARGSPMATFYGFQCALAQTWLDYSRDDSHSVGVALAIHQAALRRDPFWYIHWVNLASFEWENGENAIAIRHMQKAAEITPNKWLLWFNLALMEEQAGQVEAARQHYHLAYCLNNRLADSLLMKQNRLRMAAVETACPNDGTNNTLDPYSQLIETGITALELGDFTQALKAFEEARKANPRSALPYTYLALSRQALGERDQAESDLQASLFISSGSSDILLLAAKYARREGDIQREMDYLQQAYRLMAYPDFSWWYYQPAYSRKSLPMNLSPYLITAPLTAQQREQFSRLADHLNSIGEYRQADLILQWIDQNSNMG